jgi:hypothetical protein
MLKDKSLFKLIIRANLKQQVAHSSAPTRKLKAILEGAVIVI